MRPVYPSCALRAGSRPGRGTDGLRGVDSSWLAGWLARWAPVGLHPFHAIMAVRRPTIQSLISASYDTDTSADDKGDQHHRARLHHTQQQPQYQHVNPQQLVKQAATTMNEDGEMKARAEDGAGAANGKGEGALKGPKRGARACTNCEWKRTRGRRFDP